MEDNRSSFLEEENEKKTKIKFEKFPNDKVEDIVINNEVPVIEDNTDKKQVNEVNTLEDNGESKDSAETPILEDPAIREDKNYEKNVETKLAKVFHGFKMDKTNKIALAIYACLVFVLLLVVSSLLNNAFANGKGNSGYKMINKYTGSYAMIKSNKRENLFKEIGFEKVEEKRTTKDYKSYVTTYAYKKAYDDVPSLDSISVYYDKKDMVSYINMNLVYKNKDFISSKMTDDCNTILKNFVNLNISESSIQTVMNKKYYYSNDVTSKSSVTYMLNSFEKDGYNILTIIVDKNSSL